MGREGLQHPARAPSAPACVVTNLRYRPATFARMIRDPSTAELQKIFAGKLAAFQRRTKIASSPPAAEAGWTAGRPENQESRMLDMPPKDLDNESLTRAYARWAPVYDLVFNRLFEKGRKAAVCRQ